eukprot:gene22633-27602_t
MGGRLDIQGQLDHRARIGSDQTIKSHAAEIVKDYATNPEPLIITPNGEAKMVVMDIAEYERQQETFALLKWVPLGQKELAQRRRWINSHETAHPKLEELRALGLPHFRQRLLRQTRVIDEFDDQTVVVHLFIHTRQIQDDLHPCSFRLTLVFTSVCLLNACASSSVVEPGVVRGDRGRLKKLRSHTRPLEGTPDTSRLVQGPY